MQLILFALTGVGNVVLRALLDSGIRPDVLVTRNEKGPYPYDQVPFIGELALAEQIPWNVEAPDEQSFELTSDALLLVATYHRIIKGSVFGKFRAAVNLHPSLLPHNRGPNPFFWSIRNGDEFTGVTAHALTEGVDDGPICLQETIDVSSTETQSSLRRRLAEVAGGLAVEVVHKFYEETLTFAPQDHSLATIFPRLDGGAYEIDVYQKAEHVCRHVNALRDWPLARLGSRKIRYVKEILNPSAAAIGSVVAERTGECVVRVDDADIVLEVADELSGS